jgi:hypothetical protein
MAGNEEKQPNPYLDLLSQYGISYLPKFPGASPNMSFAGEIPSLNMSYQGPASSTSAGIVPATEPFTILGQTPSLFGNWSSGAGFGTGGYGAGNIIGPVFGALEGYKLLKDGGKQKDWKKNTLGGAKSGALVGSYFGPLGAGIGAGVGSVVGALKSAFGGHKSKDQYKRDEIRNTLERLGLASKEGGTHYLTLADGTKFNIGLDGSKAGYNMDMKNKLVQDLIPYALPLSYGIVGPNKDKESTDLTGYIVNAAVSNSGGDINKAKENLKAFYSKVGEINPEAFPAERRKILESKMRELSPGASGGGFSFEAPKAVPQLMMPNYVNLLEKYVGNNPYAVENPYSNFIGGKNG